MKKGTLTILALAAISALAAHGALQARASITPRSPAAGVARSGAKTGVRPLAAASALTPPGVEELARNQGLDLASLRQLAVTQGPRPATVVGASKGVSTCAYLTGGAGAVGGCMQLGGNLITPRIAIIDGGTYVWGLAASSVDRVQARTGGQIFAGSIDGGIFTVEVSDGANGSGPIDLLVTSGAATTAITLPGIPKPLP